MSVVGGLFNDVLNKAAVNNNVIDWSQIKPFQTVSPMQSWVATNPAATASPTASETPSKAPSEYEQWLAAQSRSKTGSGNIDRTSGPYGNGTNLSDAEWEQVKAMRDEAGGWSEYDKANMKGFLGAAAGLFGIPTPGVLQNFNNAQNILSNRMYDVSQVAPQINQYEQGLAALAEQGRLAQQAQTPPSGGLGSMAATSASPDTLSSAQQAAMAQALTNAGYYTGESPTSQEPGGSTMTGAGYYASPSVYSFGGNAGA
jgi:hypothetical protein